MGIFNNAGSVLSNVAGGLVGGVVKKVQSNLTKDAEENSWLNERGWFGSLINAQKYSHEVIMGANKERIPMIIEYLTGPVEDFNHTQQGYINSDNRKAITMYINPSRLQFNNQKIVSESVTRGGIFYHHWGIFIASIY